MYRLLYEGSGACTDFGIRVFGEFFQKVKSLKEKRRQEKACCLYNS